MSFDSIASGVVEDAAFFACMRATNSATSSCRKGTSVGDLLIILVGENDKVSLRGRNREPELKLPFHSIIDHGSWIMDRGS